MKNNDLKADTMLRNTAGRLLDTAAPAGLNSLIMESVRAEAGRLKAEARSRRKALIWIGIICLALSSFICALMNDTFALHFLRYVSEYYTFVQKAISNPHLTVPMPPPLIGQTLIYALILIALLAGDRIISRYKKRQNGRHAGL